MCLAVENLPRVTITSADPVNPLEVSWKSSAAGEEAPGDPNNDDYPPITQMDGPPRGCHCGFLLRPLIWSCVLSP
jgi:hypothetical protein